MTEPVPPSLRRLRPPWSPAGPEAVVSPLDTLFRKGRHAQLPTIRVETVGVELCPEPDPKRRPKVQRNPEDFQPLQCRRSYP